MNDGGSAFPVPAPERDAQGYVYPCEGGMKLRDYFAAMAMQGLLADSWQTTTTGTMESFVTESYKWADAMITERSKNAERTQD